MEKPSVGTILTGSVLTFAAAGFPFPFAFVLIGWIGWKIYRRFVPHRPGDVRRSIRERQARQGQRYTFAVQDETHRLRPGDPELEAAIEQFLGAARRYEAHMARRRPRDRP